MIKPVLSYFDKSKLYKQDNSVTETKLTSSGPGESWGLRGSEKMDLLLNNKSC